MSQKLYRSPCYKTKIEAVTVNAPLGDIITPLTCSKLVSEIVKFVLYRKQQIPYPFDHLQTIATRLKFQSPGITLQSHVRKGRQDKEAMKAFEVLDLIFQNLEGELHSSGSDGMKEVVLLLGSTPMSPQEIYRIILPSLAIHSDGVGIGLRPSLLHLIRHFTNSSELNDVLDRTISTTNMYVFLKKRNTNETTSSFLPKDRYSLPNRGRHVIISLEELVPGNNATILSINHVLPHSCKFIIHEDDDARSSPPPSTVNLRGALKDSTIAHSSLPCAVATEDGTQWFQSRHFLKGFTS